MIRSARISIPGGPKSTRLEVRIGGADLNPYLGVAAAVAAGLYGVEKGLSLRDKPIKGSAYQETTIPRLPRTLAVARWQCQRSFLIG